MEVRKPLQNHFNEIARAHTGGLAHLSHSDSSLLMRYQKSQGIRNHNQIFQCH